jgi:hypothetical protein
MKGMEGGEIETCDEEASIAATEVEQEIGGAEASEVQHVGGDVVRSGDEGREAGAEQVTEP